MTAAQRKADFHAWFNKQTAGKKMSGYWLSNGNYRNEDQVTAESLRRFAVESFFDIKDATWIDQLIQWVNADNILNSSSEEPVGRGVKGIVKSILEYYKKYLGEVGAIDGEEPEFDEGEGVGEDSEYLDAPSLPLNLILYGPPGTGKTYHTIKKAVEIIDGTTSHTHKDAKERFDELKKKGQIVFTTFHQSMSYEDFIEGIKPDLESGTIKYVLADGIFKEICKKTNRLSNPTFEVLLEYLKSEIESKHITKYTTLKGKLNDISLSSPSRQIVYHTGTTPRTESDTNMKLLFDDFIKTRIFDISSMSDKDLDSRISLLSKGKTKAVDTAEYKWTLNWLLDQYLWAIYPKVIIIDEINRGNIANIFGELITLIEEDKRLGNSEKMTCTLPYSKEEFGVPNNLYIIGTMNTADRSVEALDTALRRRFTFEEMMPKPELLKKTDDGINLTEFLNVINKRISLLKDREHQIGHSYFMKVTSKETLIDVIFKNVIPLLQEYFYGDYEKIQMVLGEAFIHREKPSTEFAVKNGNFDNPDYPDYIYCIAKQEEITNIDDALDSINFRFIKPDVKKPAEETKDAE